MDARQISIEDFLSTQKTRFIIPVYQRNYDWKEKNCEQLFKDMTDVATSGRKSHFMGSIVYVSNSDTDSIDLKEYVIIDGQQRLTTTTLFLKALHDEILDLELKDEIKETYLINKRLDEKNKLKLKPIKKDDEVFQKLLKDDFDTIDKNSNIYKNYQYFRSKIATFNDFKLLLNGFRKLFVVHIALNRRDDNPQLIFESINSTGVSLSQADLIRNFLLMDKEASLQEELFEKYWYKIEENLFSENISAFIRDFLTMKENKIPNKDDTYEAFKNYVQNLTIDTQGLLNELLVFSRIYKSFLFPSNEPYVKYLKNIKHLKIGVVYPFFMRLIYEFNSDRLTIEQISEVFEIVESYIVRRMVCNKATNALNKVFASLYAEVVEVENFEQAKFVEFFASILLSKRGSAIFPDDEEFRAEFISRDAYTLKNIKFILASLENKDNNEKVEIATLSIEHFMPQTLTNAWKAKLGDKWQQIHDRYLHNIGNLTLSGDNMQLGNKSFEEKRQILKEQSRLRLNRYFADAQNWSEEEIIKRAGELFAETNEIWRHPRSLISLSLAADDKESYNMDDDSIVTSKKPIYFEILGNQFSVNSWKEILIGVLTRLADIDKNKVMLLAYDDDFKGRTQRIIGINGQEIRQPHEVFDGFFVETNLSANAIISWTKLICEKFGLSGDDFVYAIRQNSI